MGSQNVGNGVYKVMPFLISERKKTEKDTIPGKNGPKSEEKQEFHGIPAEFST
jgi:hypothetical protein